MTAYAKGSERFLALKEEVSSLLQKEAVTQLSNPDPGFYSRLFVATKASGGWRPVLDVSPLNKYVVKTKFSMETSKTVLEAIGQADFMITIDMKDAYFHVPIHPRDKRYLRFVYDQKVLQFNNLCFGLSTAPQVFTRVLAPVGRILRLRGVRILMYLDDWLLLGKSYNEILHHREQALVLMEELGLTINWTKSNLTPCQTAVYLGMTIDSVRFHVSLTPKRIEKAIAIFNLFVSSSSLPAKKWQSLIGFMCSVEDLTLGARIRMRPFQFHLRENWTQGVESDTKAVVIPEYLKSKLQWFLSPGRLEEGRSLKQPSPDLTIFSDASKEGWGGTLDNLTTSGLWSTAETSLHINVLEIRAIFLCLRRWKDLVSNRCVAVCSDNTTALAYLQKKGGTHSKTLFLEAHRLLMWTELHKVTLVTQFVKGSLNVMADTLSRRNQVLPTEWCLKLEVCQALWKVWGTPSLDLFATRWNTRLPRFCSPMRDPLAIATDAFLTSWDNLLVYAFPPYALVRKVLLKVEASHNCRMILIAPWWPQREWLPDLYRLSIEPPLLLPLQDDLLSQVHLAIHHRGLHTLSLTAWLLSSESLGEKDFPLEQPRQLLSAIENPRARCTRLDGSSLGTGVGSVTSPLPDLQ